MFSPFSGDSINTILSWYFYQLQATISIQFEVEGQSDSSSIYPPGLNAMSCNICRNETCCCCWIGVAPENFGTDTCQTQLIGSASLKRVSRLWHLLMHSRHCQWALALRGIVYCFFQVGGSTARLWKKYLNQVCFLFTQSSQHCCLTLICWMNG